MKVVSSHVLGKKTESTSKVHCPEWLTYIPKTHHTAFAELSFSE